MQGNQKLLQSFLKIQFYEKVEININKQNKREYYKNLKQTPQTPQEKSAIGQGGQLVKVGL